MTRLLRLGLASALALAAASSGAAGENYKTIPDPSSKAIGPNFKVGLAPPGYKCTWSMDLKGTEINRFWSRAFRAMPAPATPMNAWPPAPPSPRASPSTS